MSPAGDPCLQTNKAWRHHDLLRFSARPCNHRGLSQKFGNPCAVGVRPPFGEMHAECGSAERLLPKRHVVLLIWMFVAPSAWVPASGVQDRSWREAASP